MARRSRKVSESVEEGTRSTLAPPWSASPSRPPRHVLYCDNEEKARRYIVNAYSLYAIKKIFDALVGDTKVEQLTRDTCEVDERITIKSDTLEDIMEYEYTSEEEAWELPSPYPQEINLFLHGNRMSQDIVHVERDDRGNVKSSSSKKPSVDRSKFVTIQDICAELKIEPRDGRAILRKAKIEKPEGGWLWQGPKADEIKKLLASKNSK